MPTFKIAIINPILNFRKFIEVQAANYHAAINSSDIFFWQRVGYTKIESCRMIQPDGKETQIENL